MRFELYMFYMFRVAEGTNQLGGSNLLDKKIYLLLLNIFEFYYSVTINE